MDHLSQWEMISIKYSQVPSFLRGGSFYNALSCEEEDGEIQVPEQFFKHNSTIDTIVDFAKLLKVTAFWSLDCLPTSMIEYCSEIDPLALSQLLSNEEYATLGFVQDLFRSRQGNFTIFLSMQLLLVGQTLFIFCLLLSFLVPRLLLQQLSMVVWIS